MSTATMTQTASSKKKAATPRSSAIMQGHSLMRSFKPKSAGRPVSAAELADNCGIGSDSGKAWISVHGHVFDITEFSKVHPGGPSIRLAAGR